MGETPKGKFLAGSPRFLTGSSELPGSYQLRPKVRGVGFRFQLGLFPEAGRQGLRSVRGPFLRNQASLFPMTR